TPAEDSRLKETIDTDFIFGEEFDTHRSEDWEKALNDEANFQFSSVHRPLVEAILNGGDSLRKKNAHASTSADDSVDVTLTDNGFTVRDTGEGMKLDTILSKLLVPKLTENTT